MTPLFASAPPVGVEVTLAESVVLPATCFATRWNWSEVPQMSAPPPVTVHVPRCRDSPPTTFGLPTSRQLQPPGQVDAPDAGFGTAVGAETVKPAKEALPSLSLALELAASPTRLVTGSTSSSVLPGTSVYVLPS